MLWYKREIKLKVNLFFYGAAPPSLIVQPFALVKVVRAAPTWMDASVASFVTLKNAQPGITQVTNNVPALVVNVVSEGITGKYYLPLWSID